MRQLMMLIFVLTMTACSATGEYRLGDGTRAAIDLQHRYCNEGDPVSRVLLLRALRDSGITDENPCEVDILDGAA